MYFLRITIIVSLLLSSAFTVKAGNDGDYEDASTRQTSLFFTVGKSKLKDTYLSVLPYKGLDIGIGLERFRTSRFKNHKWNTRHLLEIQYANTFNTPKNSVMMSMILNYGFSFYRRFEFPCGIKLYAGGELLVDAGSTYNPNNGNNPASAKGSLNLGLAGMATYKLKIKSYPINIRYSLSVPVVGMFFCPPFGESYYELFYLGNRHDWLHFGSFANQMFITNTLTLDFPIKRRSLRVGYEGKFRSMHENHLVYQYYSNTFIIGVTIDSVIKNPRRSSNEKSAALTAAWY